MGIIVSTLSVSSPAEKKPQVGCNATKVSWSRPLESRSQKVGINQLADNLPSRFPAK